MKEKGRVRTVKQRKRVKRMEKKRERRVTAEE